MVTTTLGGAAAGAAIGALGGPIGMAIGAGIGLAVGAIGGIITTHVAGVAAEAEQEALDKLTDLYRKDSTIID
jgi:outer membrane lipoprotein SlyB